jgi:hypothetical protein
MNLQAQEMTMRNKNTGFIIIPYRNLEVHEKLKKGDARFHEIIQRTAKLTLEEARHYIAIEDDEAAEGYLVFHPGEVPIDHPLLVATYEWDCRHPWKVEGRERVEAVLHGLHTEGLLSSTTLKRLLTILAEPTQQ